VGALVLVCPMIAALILVYTENGSDGVKQLLKRSFDFNSIKRKIWYVPIFFLMPSIIVLEYGLMKLMGISIPNFQFPVLVLPVFFVVFFIGGIGEEIGWTGYVTDPLQDRWNALKAGIIFGDSMASVAHNALASSSLHSNLGGRTMCEFDCDTSSYCLDLQQYRKKRIRSDRISGHG
jgi:membrane protease YdiL (CAAX protease family)